MRLGGDNEALGNSEESGKKDWRWVLLSGIKPSQLLFELEPCFVEERKHTFQGRLGEDWVERCAKCNDGSTEERGVSVPSGEAKKRTKQENHRKYFSGGLCGFHLRAPVRAPGAPGAPWVPETCGGKRDQQRCWQWADMDQSWTNVGRWSYIERLLMSPESCDILKQNNWFKRFSRYSMSCRLPKKQRKLERTESGEGGSRILMVEMKATSSSKWLGPQFWEKLAIGILRDCTDPLPHNAAETV